MQPPLERVVDRALERFSEIKKRAKANKVPKSFSFAVAEFCWQRGTTAPQISSILYEALIFFPPSVSSVTLGSLYWDLMASQLGRPSRAHCAGKSPSPPGRSPECGRGIGSSVKEDSEPDCSVVCLRGWIQTFVLGLLLYCKVLLEGGAASHQGIRLLLLVIKGELQRFLHVKIRSLVV